MPYSYSVGLVALATSNYLTAVDRFPLVSVTASFLAFVSPIARNCFKLKVFRLISSDLCVGFDI
jgi:hypothetical protein